MAFDPYGEWLEIAPDRRPPDNYALLGLAAFESDPEKIRSAGIARTAHVRKFCLGPRGAAATKLLGELANAFSCLEDPARKQAYDESLRGESQAGNAVSNQLGAEPAAPPLALRPIALAASNRDVAVAASAEPPAGEQIRARVRAASGIGSAYRAERRRAGKRSAERTLAWLVGACVFAAATIAVAAREKGLWLASAEPAASNAALADSSPHGPEATPAATVTASTDEDPKAQLSESEPAESISPAAEVASAAPLPAQIDDSDSLDAEPPAPEPKALPQLPEKPEQDAPAAASENKGQPRDTVGSDAGQKPPSAGHAEDPLEKLQRLQQDEAARENIKLGVDALKQGNYPVAVYNFSAAIEATEFRYTNDTALAAKQLDFALRSLKNAGLARGEIVRGAQRVLKDFRRRIERGKRRPPKTR